MINKPKIYVLGNLTLEIDSLPIKLIPKLKNSFPHIHFIELDPTENFPEEKNLIIIDTIINIDKITILKEEDLDKVQFQKSFSLHDYDLGFNLKLMMKLGKLESFTIIGLPPLSEYINEEEIFNSLKKEINILFSLF